MIKAHFKNIGPIKEADLELGDLTIIAGQNNTGKTYFVYTLYSFLKFFKRINFARLLRKKITIITKDLYEKEKVDIEFSEYEKIFNEALQEASQLFSEEHIHKSFSSSRDYFVDASLSCFTDIKDEKLHNITYSEISKSSTDKFSLNLSFNKNTLTLELKNLKENQIDKKLLSFAIGNIFFELMVEICPEPFILSAERFGISLFYKELDFAKSTMIEELQKMPEKKMYVDLAMRLIRNETSRYAEPIKNNIDFTRDFEEISKYKSEISDDIFRYIEKMIEGYYKAKSGDIRFISKKRKDKKFNIPLHLASSSARGIVDIYFYLKHIAKPGEILIIDEPESHLSPSNQILMTRLLTLCVKANLKVLITTHSDYIIKEFNNLIMLYGSFEGKEKFLESNKSDYKEVDGLDPKSVKAYVCEDGTLNKCVIDELGIDMPIFDDAINKINEVHNNLWLLRQPETEDD